MFVKTLEYCCYSFDLQDLPRPIAVNDADFSGVDAVFCCLPHGTTQVCLQLLCFYIKVFMHIAEKLYYAILSQTLLHIVWSTRLFENKLCNTLPNYIFYQEIIKGLPRHLKIVDLSAVCSEHTLDLSKHDVGY